MQEIEKYGFNEIKRKGKKKVGIIGQSALTDSLAGEFTSPLSDLIR